ncbi:MAG: hypothetical protein V9E94_17430 [Microthrixaceae bacterium]
MVAEVRLAERRPRDRQVDPIELELAHRALRDREVGHGERVEAPGVDADGHPLDLGHGSCRHKRGRVGPAERARGAAAGGPD